MSGQALNEQKAELLSKVHTLKKELGDWRSKLDVQVKTYRNVSAVEPGTALFSHKKNRNA
jgi:uncharacterized coiled-coil DUF342 family protein